MTTCMGHACFKQFSRSFEFMVAHSALINWSFCFIMKHAVDEYYIHILYLYQARKTQN